MEESKAKLPPFWIFAPGLLLVVALIFLNSLKPKPLLALEIGLFAPALAGIIYRCFRWKSARMLAIFVLAVYWMGMGALAVLMLTNGLFLVLYYGVFLLPAIAIVVLATHSARKRMASRWVSVAAGLGFACGVMAVVIAMTPAITRAARRAASQAPSVVLHQH